MIDIHIRVAMFKASPEQRTRLLETASNFIKDDAFLEVLKKINLNDPKAFNYREFFPFNFKNPELRKQVFDWVKSNDVL